MCDLTIRPLGLVEMMKKKIDAAVGCSDLGTIEAVVKEARTRFGGHTDLQVENNPPFSPFSPPSSPFSPHHITFLISLVPPSPPLHLADFPDFSHDPHVHHLCGLQVEITSLRIHEARLRRVLGQPDQQLALEPVTRTAVVGAGGYVGARVTAELLTCGCVTQHECTCHPAIALCATLLRFPGVDSAPGGLLDSAGVCC